MALTGVAKHMLATQDRAVRKGQRSADEAEYTRRVLDWFRANS